jgi:signal transduction histidine kinase
MIEQGHGESVAMQETKRRSQTIRHILIEIVLPTAGFGLGIGFATRDYVFSMVTALVINGAIYGLNKLDRACLAPLLKTIPHDWLQLGLAMTFSLLEHLGGALLGLLVCSRLFGVALETTVAWLALGGMVIAFPIVHGTETALRFYRQLKEKEQLEEQLRALATQAELKALKAQINPHFLFNTLNTIAELIHADPAQAEATVERLAGMFRYVLVGSERGLVPLEEELSFVESYLEIERARFGKRLRVTREIAPEALGVFAPSLLLQPLVENAVQHGQGADGNIDLTIRVRSQDGGAAVTIADRGPGVPRNWRGAGQGVGLRNVDERLRMTYGEEYMLEIQANEPHGTVATVIIPAEGRAGIERTPPSTARKQEYTRRDDAHANADR